MTADLDGRTAVVTGAAGALGRVVVETFAARGARVVAVDVDADALESECAGERVERLAVDPGQDLTRFDEVSLVRGDVNDATRQLGGDMDLLRLEPPVPDRKPLGRPVSCRP